MKPQVRAWLMSKHFMVSLSDVNLDRSRFREGILVSPEIDELPVVLSGLVLDHFLHAGLGKLMARIFFTIGNHHKHDFVRPVWFRNSGEGFARADNSLSQGIEQWGAATRQVGVLVEPRHLVNLSGFVDYVRAFTVELDQGEGGVVTGGGVAYWAHIGGFVAGLVLTFLLRGFARPALANTTPTRRSFSR